MATHSSILAWRIPWTKEWWATVHCHKELGTTEETCMQHLRIKLLLVGPPAGGSRRKGSKPSQQLWNHPKEAFTFPTYKCFPGGSAGKESACDVGDAGSIPGSGRSPGEENGNLLKCSYLGNSMDRGAWQATVYGVQKSWVTNVSPSSPRWWPSQPFNRLQAEDSGKNANMSLAYYLLF